MATDLSRITSLDRPPDDWDWRGDDRARRARALDGGSTRTWTNRQARPPIEPRSTADLPVLVPGRDHLPTLCSACGSALLEKEPPLGEHQRGLMTCRVCGEQLCWLGSPIDEPRMRPAAGPLRLAQQPAPVAIQIPIQARFTRIPGCGPACGAIYGHDPVAHEAYGRRQAEIEAQPKRTGIVRTGPLVVDLDSRRVLVGGTEIRLTPTEEAILTVLAGRVGAACTVVEIVSQVWGAGQLGLEQADSKARWHITRVHMARLRAKLGEARGLVTTRPWRGYRLEAMPPEGGEGEP